MLERLIRIKRGESRVFVPATGKIPQRSNVGKPREVPRNHRERGQREVLNNSAVLL